MSVRCGNRKAHQGQSGTHESAAEGRACFAGTYAQTSASAPVPERPIPSQSVPARLAAAPSPLSVAKGVLHEGYFTVVFAEDDRITLRVRRQRKNSTFRPGELLVSYLSGSDNEGDYTGFAFVDESGPAPIVRLWKKHRGNERLTQAVKVLAGDPQAAAKAFAVESDHCSKCGLLLTVPQGPDNPYRDQGYGPKCGADIFG
jgi:hypothetical protein